MSEASIAPKTVLVKALENGVRVATVAGDTGEEVVTLQSGEVVVLQLGPDRLGVRVTGRAEVNSEVGRVTAGDTSRTAGFAPVGQGTS